MMVSGSRLKALLVIAVVATVVSLYQWIALIELRSGKEVAFCIPGSWTDCASIWNSSLSVAIHAYTLLPVPAWGVLWGLVVMVLIFRVVFLRRQQISNKKMGHGLCVLIIGAGLAVTALLLYGFVHGGLCVTCWIFYALVYSACFIMRKNCRISLNDLFQGAGQLPMTLVAVYIVLLYPAVNTPTSTHVTSIALTNKVTKQETNTDDADYLQHALALYLQSLPLEMQQTLSVALFIYRTSPFVDQPVDEKRLVFGPKDAPVHFVGWVDMHQCPQCRFIEESLFKLRRAAPRGAWNYEIRQFPIASQCNPYIKVKDRSGVSCLGAKILICTKNKTMNDLLRLNFYRNMSVLSPQIMWSIVNDSGLDHDKMARCVRSKATKKRLLKDINDARDNFIRGVPMIAVNGRKATFHPSFLYSLILAGGKDDHPAFDVMAAPSEK